MPESDVAAFGFFFGLAIGALIAGTAGYHFGWLRGMRQWRDDRGFK